jgi:DNA primase catalytic core
MTTDRLSGRKTLKVDGFLEEFEKDEIKSRVDIIILFSHFGVKLTPKGKGFTGKCPWHEDKDPSLSVDRDKGLYHCFGCGESGDTFALVEKVKGVGFREALEYLKAYAGSVPPKRPEAKAAAQKIEVVHTAPEKDDHPELTLSVITDHYHARFLESKDARAYIERRGIANPEIIRRFKIGFADGSILSMVSNGQKGKLKSLGILTEAGRELFHNAVTFPILDENGQSVGMYARSIDARAKVKHLYLPGRHHGIFNRGASMAFREIILTEGVIDALSLIALGVENVQACYGAKGFTEEHLTILRQDRVKMLIIAFDNDEAGRKASGELAGRLLREGFSVKQTFPSRKDWNEEIIAGTDAAAVKTLVDTAELLVPKTFDQPSEKLEVRTEGSRYQFTLNGISYRLWGAREMFTTNLRVSMRAESRGECFYDNLDLYSSRSRTFYSQNLASLFEREPKRIEKDLLAILEYMEAERDKRLESSSTVPAKREPTEEEKRLGMEFLTSPGLFDQIVSDMETLGYVGEDLNKLLVYIAASSRKLEDPISILILSQSASGKSFLVDTVKKLIPPEEVISVTSLSDQALNYLPEGDLLHKFLILGEAVHSEVIEHQIREMLSGHQLSRMVTLKDEKTGKMESHTRASPVIVSAIMSSTRADINAENASRCFLINADESVAQTARIHASQREKYSLARYFQRRTAVPRIIAKHHAAQRLLRPLLIVNPFAPFLDFPHSLVRTRRDHERFVDLIACVCFLRQYRKEARQSRDPETGDVAEYVECDIEDYRVAYRIMTGGVMRSTYAEVPRSMADFYEELRELFRLHARESGLKPLEVGLTQREVRKGVGGLGSESVKKYLRRLVALEYLQLVHGGERGMRNNYRLIADEPMERLDCSMIPTPDEIERLQAGK